MTVSAFEAPGRFYRGNIHTHSTNSDGKLPAQDVCRHYREANYDFLMLSDHFLPEYDFPITDTRDYRTSDFTTVIGAELHAPATALGELWHIVAAGLPLDFEAPDKNESGPELAQRAADAGAFIGLAHPAWYGLTTEDAKTIDAAHAIEIYNYGCAIETDRADGFYVLEALLNDGHRLSAYATDDAHFHQDDYFGAWMMVKAENLEPKTLVSAMKEGNYYSSESPEIHSIGLVNGTVEIECSAARTIAVLGRAARSERCNGGGVTQACLPIERFAGDWFRIVVMDDVGKRAWTNPIWID